MYKNRALSKKDVLVALVIILISIFILTSILFKVRQGAFSKVCQSNLLTLSNGWAAYSSDNDGDIVNGIAGLKNPPSWIGQDWASTNLLSEDEQIKAVKSGKLWPYTYFSDWHCNSSLSGHFRSYSIVDSMNGIPRQGTLDEEGTYIKNINQINNPSQRIVFICLGQVIPDTYAVYYNQQKWWDQPPIHHNNGTNVSFADKHVEYWKWSGKETLQKGRTAKSIYEPDAINHWSPQTSEGINDLHQVQIHTWGQLGY